jgi:hypothetical protein
MSEGLDNIHYRFHRTTRDSYYVDIDWSNACEDEGYQDLSFHDPDFLSLMDTFTELLTRPESVYHSNQAVVEFPWEQSSQERVRLSSGERKLIERVAKIHNTRFLE